MMMTPTERWHAYRNAFSTLDGQKVLHDLRHHFGYENRTTIDADSPHKTYAAEGHRLVLVYIRSILSAEQPPEEDLDQVEFDFDDPKGDENYG